LIYSDHASHFDLEPDFTAFAFYCDGVADPDHPHFSSLGGRDPDHNRIRQIHNFFGPPGSGSFYHQAKIVRKTLIPNVCDFFLTFLSLINDVHKYTFKK
jgi:hypothetical protein